MKTLINGIWFLPIWISGNRKTKMINQGLTEDTISLLIVLLLFLTTFIILVSALLLLKKYSMKNDFKVPKFVSFFFCSAIGVMVLWLLVCVVAAFIIGDLGFQTPTINSQWLQDFESKINSSLNGEKLPLNISDWFTEERRNKIPQSFLSDWDKLSEVFKNGYLIK